MAPGPKSVGCAKCCAVFSTTGFIFCLIIGAILQNQPIFVEGVDDPKKASGQCYGAAGIYIACVVRSLSYLLSRRMQVISLVVLFVDSVQPKIPGPAFTYVDNLPPGLGDRQNRLPMRSNNNQSIELSPQGQML